MDRRKRMIIRLMRTAVVLLFAMPLLSRCATMMTPQGGPKDTIPPVIVAMIPDNFTTHMKDRTKIYIEFDEFVQLKDQQKEFFTSPEMKKKPILTLRGRGVVVQLRDTLRPNTTYALNFGNTIRDNNENNPLSSMRYVFSTGSEIDSMVMSGYTADAYKADSVPKSFVYFFIADSVENHPEYDSTMFKYKPQVIARAETNGIFIAQNLKPVPYLVYAVQDKNDNQMYDPASDQIGFLDGTYNPVDLAGFGIWYDSLRRYATADPQLYFRMFTDATFRRQSFTQAERPQQHKAIIYFNGPHPEIQELVFDSIPSERIIIEPLNPKRDTLALWFNIPSAEMPDTLKGTLTYLKHDSLNMLVPATEKLKLAWHKIESKDEVRMRERQEKERRKAEEAGREYKEPKEKNPFAYKLPLSGEINPENRLTAEFDYPLVKIDSASLLLTLTDDEGVVTDLPVRIVPDTASIHRWLFEAPWRRQGQYTLTIPEGALTDVAGHSNDSLVGKYTTMDPEKYAVVKLTLTPKRDGSKYVVQLLDGGGRLLQERRDIDSGLVQYNFVSPGDIQLRVIEDRNRNGLWDTGNMIERRQPERAELYAGEDGNTLFTTKANWEFEITMDMNALFAPVTMESLSQMLEEREIQRLKREEEKRRKEGPKKAENENHNGNSGFGFGGNSGGNSGGFGGNSGGFGGNNSGSNRGGMMNRNTMR